MSFGARIRKTVRPAAYFRKRSGPLPAVPAYFFHQADPAGFGTLARAIEEGGFETPFFERLLGGDSPGKREVLLSFDDGWSSVFSVALPLARRHGLRFTLFLAPENVEDSDEVRTTTDDGAAPEDLVRRDLGPRGMLTKGEVRSLHESGLVSIQSHSLHHGQVFLSDRVVDFVRPGRPLPLEGIAPLLERREEGDRIVRNVPAGTPLFETGGALFARRRYLESEGAREACVRHVAENGGDRFFERPGWRGELERFAREGAPGRWETDDERRARFEEDLRRGKGMLESIAPGLRVRMVAPPWGAFHPDLPRVAAGTGHEMMVLADPFPDCGTAPSPLPLYPRLKGDGIWFLLRGPLAGWAPYLRARRASRARIGRRAVP